MHVILHMSGVNNVLVSLVEHVTTEMTGREAGQGRAGQGKAAPQSCHRLGLLVITDASPSNLAADFACCQSLH